MSIRIRKGILPLAIASLLAAPTVMAQSATSSAVTGVVVNAQGQPVSGATVKIENVPSGTTRVATTDKSGRYNAKGLRVGGPYDITVSKSGLPQSERGKIYLQLGQTSAINLIMQPSTANAQKLGTVVVSANTLMPIFSPANKGVSTNISQRQLNAMPTPGRTIQDVIRMDPMINITDRSTGQFSALGQNFLYNNITVDGVSDNNPYGLGGTSLPTTATPISQNTIAGYNISTANYDVTNRRGVGASINAVIKSGTNHFHGSVYDVFQSHDWIGKNSEGKKFTGFDRRWTAGAILGGPIIKNKLFFFLSYEKSEQVGAASFYGPEGSGAAQTVTGLTMADLQAIKNIAKGYGMEGLGSFTGGNNNLITKRYLAKIDWNINGNHRISFTARRTQEGEPEISAGSPNGLTLSSGWNIKNTLAKAYSLQSYDDWTDNFSTKTSLAYRTWDRAGGSFNGAQLPDISVSVDGYGSPRVSFGTDHSYQYNGVKTADLSASWIATWFKGDHAFKFGIGFEKQNKHDKFLQNFYGSYSFDCILTANCASGLSFQSGDYFEYQYAHPVYNNPLNADAVYSIKRLSAFAQDTWQVSNNLSVQYGVRLDKYTLGRKPFFNPEFAAAGFTTPTGRVLTTNQYTGSDKPIVQPRVSFNYSFDTQRMMQLRGGIGLFLTQPPAVWVGNAYNNTGNNVVSYVCGPNERGCDTNLPKFSPDPHHQNPGSPLSASETVNTIDPDFRLPQALKFSLGYDVQLPWWGLVGTVNYMHLNTRYDIWFQQVNLGKLTGTLPDSRNSYYCHPGEAPRARRNYTACNSNLAFDSSSTINLASTTKGKDDTLTLQLRKPFHNGWSWMVAATFNHATDVNPGVGSTARSNYSLMTLVNPSANVTGVSNYNVALHAIASIQWRHAFFGHYYTRFSAFWSGQDGHPYSWIFGNDANGDGFSNDLLYIPKPGQVTFCAGDDGDCATPNPQRVKEFWAYIQSNKYLRKHQGQIAARNAVRAPWYNKMDISFSQEIPGIFKGNKGIIRLDIYNFLNLLNKHWGLEYVAAYPGERDLANFYGVDPTTGKYIYNIDQSEYGVSDTTHPSGAYHPQEIFLNSSASGSDIGQRWHVQLTLTYKF